MLCRESLTITSADAGTEEPDCSGPVPTSDLPASEAPLGLRVDGDGAEGTVSGCVRADLVCTYREIN